MTNEKDSSIQSAISSKYRLLAIGYTKTAICFSNRFPMNITKMVAERSTCLRRKVGAILVRDKRILTTGYNGAPKGFKHCSVVGCIRDQQNVSSGARHELCRGLHAEMNALLQAASYGICIEGATLYSTTYPCSLCAKMLINAGIREIVVCEDYKDELSKKMLRLAKIPTKIIK